MYSCKGFKTIEEARKFVVEEKLPVFKTFVYDGSVSFVRKEYEEVCSRFYIDMENNTVVVVWEI